MILDTRSLAWTAAHTWIRAGLALVIIAGAILAILALTRRPIPPMEPR